MEHSSTLKRLKEFSSSKITKKTPVVCWLYALQWTQTGIGWRWGFLRKGYFVLIHSHQITCWPMVRVTLNYCDYSHVLYFLFFSFLFFLIKFQQQQHQQKPHQGGRPPRASPAGTWPYPSWTPVGYTPQRFPAPIFNFQHPGVRKTAW